MAWLSFQESLVTSDDHYLMGRKLRPFCLEYQFWLEAIKSPLLTGGDLGVIDFELASLICSSGYRQSSAIQRRRLNFFQKILWGIKVLRTDLRKERAAWERYLIDHCSMPERWGDNSGETEDGQKYTDFPSVLGIVALLMKNNFEGGSRESIFMAPLGEVHWYAVAFYRNDGTDVGLITDHDREMMEGIRKMKARSAQSAS
jgi:hypothetical protein